MVKVQSGIVSAVFLIVLGVGVLMVAGLLPNISISGIATVTPAATGPPWFSSLVVIMLEGQSGNSYPPNTPASPSYMAGLYTTWASFQQMHHEAAPSLPNYIAFSSGSTQGIADDNDPSSHQLTVPNIIDGLEGKGVSWNAYAENYPVTQGCTLSGSSGSWYARHFPFNYYTDIESSAARCNNLFDAGASDSVFLAALNSATPPGFVWLTPNGCNDGHDCGPSTVDSYLSGLVPQILSSSMFATGKAALVITMDENNNAQSNPLYTVWLGSPVKKPYSDSIVYNHDNILRTLEDNWGIAPLCSSSCGTATSINGVACTCGPNGDGVAVDMPVFGTATGTADFSLAASPSTVSFTAGSTTSVTITMAPLSGFTGTVTLTVNSPSVTASCSSTSLTLAAPQSQCTFSAATATSETSTFTGVSGSLSHTVSVSVTVSSTSSGNFNPSQWSTTCPSPSSCAFNNGILTETVVDTAGGYTGSFYATVQYLGRNGYTGPPIPISSFSSSVNINTITLANTAYVYHAYIGLYYLLNHTYTISGVTSNAIDGQVQVEQCSNTISGGCDPAGYTYTSAFTGTSPRFGYREILTQDQAGTSYTFSSYDVNGFCGRALAAWGIPSQSCSLVRLEPGAEAYGVNPFSIQWTSFAVSASPTCSNGATNPPSCNVCPPGQVLQNNVCINPTGDFTISVTPNLVSGTGSGQAVINLAGIAGYTGVATLSSQGPTLLCTFAQTQILIPGQGTVSCSLPSGTMSTITANVTITAISGSLSHTATVEFVLAPAPVSSPPVVAVGLILVGVVGGVATFPRRKR